VNRLSVSLKTAVFAAVLLVFSAGTLFAGPQRGDLLSGIRESQAELQYFFSQMPKGGDLHNHLTGSVYAETYFKIAIEAGMYLDTQTYKLYAADDAKKPASCIRLEPDMADLHAVYVQWQCIDHWSARNFQNYVQTLPPDEFFFGSFGIFGAADETAEYGITLLKELRARAALENVLYLEVMLTSSYIHS
jgi:adenosine deaminase